MSRRISIFVVVLGAALTAVYFATKSSSSSVGSGSRIVLYNWSEYMDPQVLVDFKNETGIEVFEEIFDSNETLRSKLLAGATGYDVIVPSGYAVELLARDGLLAELDLQKITNLSHINPVFRNKFYDPAEKYSVPYLYMTTGIGYRKDLVEAKAWDSLFETNDLTSSKISMLDDPRETLGVALQHLGYSANSVNPTEIDAAVDLLSKQKSRLSRYTSESYAEFLAAGDLLIAHGWGGTIYRMRSKDPNIAYVVPQKGGIVGTDCFAVPKSSTHMEEALRFIDFVQRPEINARIVKATFYPSTNASASKFLPSEITGPSGIYIDDASLQSMEWIRDLGEANLLYEKAWERVRYARL